jgi:ribosomal protein S26
MNGICVKCNTNGAQVKVEFIVEQSFWHGVDTINCKRLEKNSVILVYKFSGTLRNHACINTAVHKFIIL